MMRRSLAGLPLAIALAIVACGEARTARPDRAPAVAGPAIPDTAFARLHRALSGPGAYFDTDNLISNEDSYLHAVGTLRAEGLNGGVYLGVGPDQNFSYMAELRPALALVVDIRRDNALLHFLFRALFHRADNRLEYLCALFGRDCPAADPSAWTADRLLDTVERSAPLPDQAGTLRASIRGMLESGPVPLSDADLAAIDRFHRRYMVEGLGLRFNSHGRAPNPWYPTFRRLLLETTRTGEAASFVATEEAFRVVDALQDSNRVIPVVGDLAGAVALPAIAAWLEAGSPYLGPGQARVSALYTSNVEFYLLRAGTFGPFVENLRALPRDGGVIIRSYFNRTRGGHPGSVRGYYSTQMVQPIDALVRAVDEGRIRSYGQLITRGILEPR